MSIWPGVFCSGDGVDRLNRSSEPKERSRFSAERLTARHRSSSSAHAFQPHAVTGAAGSTGMVYGLLAFSEYKGASRNKKALLLLALGLYPSSIALIALSF
mgnify:CR=1 FL=1